MSTYNQQSDRQELLQDIKSQKRNLNHVHKTSDRSHFNHGVFGKDKYRAQTKETHPRGKLLSDIKNERKKLNHVSQSNDRSSLNKQAFINNRRMENISRAQNSSHPGRAAMLNQIENKDVPKLRHVQTPQDRSIPNIGLYGDEVQRNIVANKKKPRAQAPPPQHQRREHRSIGTAIKEESREIKQDVKDMVKEFKVETGISSAKSKDTIVH